MLVMMKMVILYFLKKHKKKVSFELDGSDGNLKNFDSTIIGLIGFVLQVIHHLEHHEEKVVEYN